MDGSELEYLWSAMRFKYGYLIGFASWQTAIRFAMVCINSKLKEWMENAIPEDKEWAANLFKHRGYRIFVFILNALLTVKLPTVGRKISTGDTTTTTKV